MARNRRGALAYSEPMRDALLLTSLLTLLLPVISGCPSEAAHDHGLCVDADGTEPYEAGMSKVGDSGALTFTLDSADPAPPDLDDNDWTLTVTDGAGVGVAGCVLTAIPFMEDHGHGTNEPSSEPTDAAGTATIPAMEITMPGVWRFTVTAECDDGTEDEAVFRFCVEG